jgi:hypothetical protein
MLGSGPHRVGPAPTSPSVRVRTGKIFLFTLSRTSVASRLTSTIWILSPRLASCRGKGCDGNGKIKGGIAAVPGFGWWPIRVSLSSSGKRHAARCTHRGQCFIFADQVYRPCPASLDAGYGYKRKGATFGEFIEGKRATSENQKGDE